MPTEQYHWIVNEAGPQRTLPLDDLLNDLSAAGFEIFAVLPDRTVIARKPKEADNA